MNPMNTVTRLTPPQPGATAPGATHLSQVMVEDIDKIGNDTATQMERAAVAIENAASEAAGKLIADAKESADEWRAAAKTFREKTRAMSEQVSDFCLRTTSARTQVRGIEFEVRDKVSTDATA